MDDLTRVCNFFYDKENNNIVISPYDYEKFIAFADFYKRENFVRFFSNGEIKFKDYNVVFRDIAEYLRTTTILPR